MRHTAIIVALLAFAVLLPAATDTTAAPSWKQFGIATSHGRGSIGSPFVSVDSTTQRHPKRVRIVFRDSTRQKRSNASWSVFCWRQSNFQTWRRGSDGKVHMPKTITWDPPAWVDFCEVSGTAWHIDRGFLKLVVQAHY